MMDKAALGAIAVAALAACSDGPDSHPSPDSSAVVTDSLVADLQFLREEEKLARDTYVTLYARWQLMPHQRISSSEQAHMDSVANVLVSLSIADPVVDDTVGAFVNPQLAALYTQLVTTGDASEIAALEVGATIEDLDLRDIAEMSTRATEPGVLAMYATLACGSRNHLRAFTSQLAMRGTSYTPQYLTREVYDAVLAGPHESCGQ